MKYLLAGLLLAAELRAAPLSITPNGSDASIVTAGIPFAACALADASNFRLLDDNGKEVPIFIKPTLLWPASKCGGTETIRAVKIQFAYDSKRKATYDWEFAARTLPDLQEAPVAEVNPDDPRRAGYKEPAFFAINDPAYLVTTGLIPPTTAAGKNDHDSKWYPDAFAKRVRITDFSDVTDSEKWLFDSVSTLYQQALRSGSLEQYREAYLEHEFYMSKWVVQPQVNAEEDSWYVGSWSLAPGDVKFVYLTPMKLHLALTGDDTWQPSEIGTLSPLVTDRETFIRHVASRAMSTNGIKGYSEIGGQFTERNAGFALQQLVAAYELTNDATILTNIKTAVNNLYKMMTANPDGKGNAYLSHSWEMHEGYFPAFIGKGPVITGPVSEVTLTGAVADDYTKIPAGAGVGFYLDTVNYGILASAPIKNADGTLTLKFTAPVTMPSEAFVRFGEAPTKRWTPVMNFTADRVFSVWMQSIAADALWQVYNLLDDPEVKRQSSEMLLNFGRSVVAYGIDGTGLAADIKTKIETAFGVKVQSGYADGSRRIVPYARYVASSAMAVDGAADYINYMNIDGSYSDQHSPEALFQIALAINFETDPAKKAAMTAVAEGLAEYFDRGNIGLTIVDNQPARYFNWTNKPNAWGTYEVLKQKAD